VELKAKEGLLNDKIRRMKTRRSVAEEVTFKCLRCGYEYKGVYDRKVPEERECPKCGSNSIRPLPEKESNI